MIKIKGVYLAGALAFAVVAASGNLLFRGSFSFGLALVYIILLSLAPYTLHDIKIEKKELASACLFASAIAAISVAVFLMGFHDGRLLPYGILLIAAGFALIIIRSKAAQGAVIEENDGLRFGRWREIAWLGAILALALVIRIYRHDSIPPGVWFDEAQNGLETAAIMKGAPFQVFIPRLTMMPAMYFYIASAFTQFLGVNIFAMRLVCVIAGVLSVAAFYFFARAAFKDVKLALAGAAMLAMSRWHIIFSRVAFLGMLMVLLEIACFYFYYRTLTKKSSFPGVITGLAMGLSFYSFSAADFIPAIIAVHAGFLFLKRKREFIKDDLRNIALIFGVAVVIGAPLLAYALQNPAMFSRRISEVSITNEMKTQGSIMPLVNSVKAHLLMFNYEGDYNGRHNLYKKPMVDFITGTLLAAGVFLALANPGNVFYLIWFAAMLSAGIFTLSIEAPQAYRTIGALPCLYFFVLMAIKEARGVLRAINPSKNLSAAFVITVVACSGALNLYQYFDLYPAEKATYLSFSPEANAIAGFIAENEADYIIYSSTGGKLYGFYPFEQRTISDFVNYGGPGYLYMTEDNMVDKALLAKKKGIIALIRPDDTAEEKNIGKLFPGARKKEYRNSVTDEVMFVCYYIDASIIGKKKDASKPMIFYIR